MTRLWVGLVLAAPLFAQDAAGTWKFAVSGDSRNCGDIVMPAIAAGVQQAGAGFYWHLGDFRAIYTFDEDLVPPASLGLPPANLNIITYETTAWADFILRQLTPFGNVPVFLTPGNHETIPPSTRDSYLLHFADWLTTPELRRQRLADDPTDHTLHTYYHWMDRNVDFISLDNASTDQFDDAQLRWFQGVMKRAEQSPAIRTIVVGMHAALPGSFGANHSMDDWAQGQASGRKVYEALWHAKDSAHKNVYIVSSHSHFFMENVYRTDPWKGKEIPGWIVGTAGAVRYRLPNNAPANSMTDVYGYLLGTVSPEGAIDFAFQKLTVDDLLRANQGRLADSLVHWCFDKNN